MDRFRRCSRRRYTRGWLQPPGCMFMQPATCAGNRAVVEHHGGSDEPREGEGWAVWRIRIQEITCAKYVRSRVGPWVAGLDGGPERGVVARGDAVMVSGAWPTAGGEDAATSDADGRGGGDWLSKAWWRLSDRYRDVLVRRLAGEHLAHIGGVYGVSRGRVRQLQVSAEKHLLVAEDRHASGLVDQLAVVVGNHPAVTNAEVVVLVPTAVGPARRALLHAHGLTHPRTFTGELTGWWTQHPTALGVLLGELVALAPLSVEDLQLVAA